MSFADELRAKTRTTARAAEKEKQQQFDAEIENYVKTIKWVCLNAADEGLRSTKHLINEGMTADEPWCFCDKEKAVLYAEAIKARLAKEGLDDVSYEIKEPEEPTNKQALYAILLTIAW